MDNFRGSYIPFTGFFAVSVGDLLKVVWWVSFHPLYIIVSVICMKQLVDFSTQLPQVLLWP